MKDFTMKKRVSIVLSLCLAVLLLLGIGGYAYVSDYYRADEIAIAAAACQTRVLNAPPRHPVTRRIPLPVSGQSRGVYLSDVLPCLTHRKKKRDERIPYAPPVIFYAAECRTPLPATSLRLTARFLR